MAVPTLGSSPETSFYFGAVGLVDFRHRYDSTRRHSPAKLELTYTLNRQFIIGSEWTIADWEKKWILFGRNSWMRFPELFWGVGGNMPKDQEIQYSAYRLELNNSLYRSVGSDLLVGISQQFQQVYDLSVASEYSEKEAKPLLSNGHSSGLGLGFLIDSRTNLLNPRPKEKYLQLVGQRFNKLFGSQFSFWSLDFDARYYLGISKKSLLAFQAISQFRSPGAPYRMLALLGGGNTFRGYYQGRYRDHGLFGFQSEFRWYFSKWVGMTAFSGLGNTFSFQEKERAGELKWSNGLGLRILADPKGNSFLRMDFAYTRQGDFGFYFAFGEAF